MDIWERVLPNATPWHWLTARAYMANMKPIDLERHPPEAEVVASFPPEIARRFQVVPVTHYQNELVVAVSDVATVDSLAEIEAACGSPVRPVLAEAAQVVSALERYFPATP